MLGQENQNCFQTQHFPQDRIYSEPQERVALRWQQQQQQHDVYINSIQQLSVEVDCIDSFRDFATYLDKVNPICTPDSIDTVDKLLNTLAQR